MEIEKAPFSEDFENALQEGLSPKCFVVTKKFLLCGAFGDDLLDNDESVVGNVSHNNFSENSFADINKNVLLNELSGDSSVDIDKNFLHNDLSGDSSVDVDKNVLHNDLSGDSSVDVDKNVLHNDLSGDSSVDIDKNVLHNDLSGDSSVDVDKNVLQSDMSGNSSVDVDKNVLHNDLSGDSSVDVDKNVLHNDLSGDSSVDIDKNVLHNDLSGDSSVDVDKNVLQSDISGNSSVDVDKNVLHNDLSGDSSVDVDKNVLHNDLSGDSSVDIDKNVLQSDMSGNSSVDVDKNVLQSDMSGNSSVDVDKNVLQSDMSGNSSVDVDKNVLHNDLSGDSSVDVDKNVLHNDLSGDSSVDIDKNVLQSDMSGNSSVNIVLPNLPANSFIKICEKGIIDSSEYFKTSKSGFQNALLEVISIKMSKLFHGSKLDSSNTHHTKAKDNGGSWLETSEIGCIRSNMEMLKILGIFPRFSESPPIFWQEITLYPFRRHTNGDLHQLMCYEVFRLCSFSYARFPADFDVWVTRLAQAGFYCENGRIVCFHCGREFQGTVGSSVENVHHPECNHHEHSRPLHVWTEGLNQDVLAIYYNRYGSLRPYNFEVSGHQGFIDQIDRPHEAIPGSDMGEPEAQRYGEQDSSDTSMGRESGIPVLTEVTMGDSAIEEPARPEYHSEALPTDPSQANRDHGFGDQRHSLPGNLNEVSGAVVSEESQEPQESYQMLTSAASNPMPFYNPAARGSQSQGDDGNENGAVGGAGVTLDLSKASYPLFSSAEARRQTFTSWSVTHSHRPEDLVAAGFFYAGYADCVRCFYCGLGLKYWRPTDIPAYQHARYRPHCVYNRLYKGPDYIARVQQDLQSEEGTTDQLVDGIRLTQGEVTAAAVARPAGVQDAVAPGTGTPLVAAPSVPDLMNSEVAQEALRNGWERNQVQRAVDHIVREFGVHCLEISLLLDVLTNLNMDNPERNQPSPGSLGSADSGINEQPVPPAPAAAAVSENHNVVSSRRGIDVSDAAQEEANTLHIRAVPTQQPAPPAVEFNELFRSVEREHTLLAERTTCRLCRRRPVSCIYLPCGHVIACQECADNATHCILCSRQIIGTANIFLA
ncbi:hypothetical protein BsWGS_12541 [Bradybaena similaris]